MTTPKNSPRTSHQEKPAARVASEAACQIDPRTQRREQPSRQEDIKACPSSARPSDFPGGFLPPIELLKRLISAVPPQRPIA